MTKKKKKSGPSTTKGGGQQKPKVKYYAVARGRQGPGVLTSWDECQKQVKGHKHCLYKSFPSRVEAEAYLQEVHSVASSSIVPANSAAVRQDALVPSTATAATTTTPSTVVIQSGSSVTTISAPSNAVISIHISSDGASTNAAPRITVSQPPAALREEHVPTRPLAIESEERKPVARIQNAIARLTRPPPPKEEEKQQQPRKIQIWFDGGCRGNPSVRAGAGAVVAMNDQTCHVRLALNPIDPTNSKSSRAVPFTNNQAEYTGIIAALRVMLDFLRRQKPVTGIPRLDLLEIRGDSLLIINQLNGSYQCKSPSLRDFYQQTRTLLRQCMEQYMSSSSSSSPALVKESGLHPGIRLLHVYRDANATADALANEAMDENGSWMTLSDDHHQQRYPLPTFAE